MPLYTFYSEKDDKYIDVLMGMNEDHVYIDDSGYQWRRIFYKPQMATDTKYDFRNAKAFSDYTRNKKGTLGNLWDEAKEASMKREDKDGKDSIKENYYKNYSKARRNKIHPEVKKEKALKELQKNFDVEL